MATVADLRTYLGQSGQNGRWDDAALTAVLATENAAQSARCKIPTDGATPPLEVIPADLAEALLRRCAVNLARRPLTLGVTEASGDGTPSAYLPGSDPEVRRLEAPYRRRVVG